MSAVPEASKAQSKKFQKGERSIGPKSSSAKKFYPADDEKAPKKARKSIHPAKPRESLQPGTILILLAGRFRGKRVVLLKHLDQGVLLVTGPFKINGVPLRRVNARYVIATSFKVDLKGIDASTVEKVASKDYFTADKAKEKKASEEAFFKQGEKAEKKKIPSARAQDQKSVDKSLLAEIKKEKHLAAYLATSFSLRNGQKPHEMKF